MKRCTAGCISVCVPLLCAAIFCLRKQIAALPLPACQFHTLTGYLCPGCGNTRAVLTLLQGHLLLCWGYNPMIPVLCLALLLLYGEVLCLALGKPLRLLPRRNSLLFLVVGLVLVYDIMRNFFPAMTLCL